MRGIWLYLSVFFGTLVLMAAFGAAGFGLHERFNRTDELRKQALAQKVAQQKGFHDVFCFFADTIAQNPKMTKKEVADTYVFFDKALDKIGAAPCVPGESEKKKR